jgi:hypothetical protein
VAAANSVSTNFWCNASTLFVLALQRFQMAIDWWNKVSFEQYNWPSHDSADCPSVLKHDPNYTKYTCLFANNLCSTFLNYCWNFHEQIETVL